MNQTGSMITYIADNQFYLPAYMDFTTSKFNYGDWKNAFFMKVKPCLVRFSGEVAYYLNPQDYSKILESGVGSNISELYVGGNVMVEIPKIYWKIVPGTNQAAIYFSNKKLDDDFHCWAHINKLGKESDFIYLSAYNGSLVDSQLRSLSKRTPTLQLTAQQELDYADSNGTGYPSLLYSTLTFSQWTLINLLLMLISKTTDNKKAFGTGNNSSYVSAENTGIKNSGSMDSKGLFWGDNGTGVKLFGIEHWWGNVYKRIAGFIHDNAVQKVKLTYGKSDGTTVVGYNLDGSGYLTIGDSTCIGSSGGYLSKVLANSKGFLLPKEVNGSASTYFCSKIYFYPSGGTRYATFGGYTLTKEGAGGMILFPTYIDYSGKTLIGSYLSLIK